MGSPTGRHSTVGSKGLRFIGPHERQLCTMPIPSPLIRPETILFEVIEYLVEETALTETMLLVSALVLLAVAVGGLWLLEETHRELDRRQAG